MNNNWASFIGSALLGAAIALLVMVKVVSPEQAGKSDVLVVVDIIQIHNAARASASQLIGQNLSVEDIPQIVDAVDSVSTRTKDIIREIVGPGTPVFLKQSVILGAEQRYVDITADVLKKLNLPLSGSPNHVSNAQLDRFADTVATADKEMVQPINRMLSGASRNSGLTPP